MLEHPVAACTVCGGILEPGVIGDYCLDCFYLTHVETVETRAGVPTIRFHDLRHTSATLLLAEGVHGKIVQERLGHSNIAMTLDLYSHVTADMQRQAADTLEAAIAGAKERIA